MGFGLSPMELMVVLVIAVLLFGRKLPEVGRSLGKSVIEFKKGLNDIKNELDVATTSPTTTRPAVPKYTADDYDEPTAPKFEPPTQAPTERIERNEPHEQA